MGNNDIAAGSREPSYTAMFHAWLRHMHATIHPAPIYSDTRSVQLVPEQTLARVRSIMVDFSQETTDALSLLAVIRHRVLAD